MKTMLEQAIQKRWYAQTPGILKIFSPLEVLFKSVAQRRSQRHGLFARSVKGEPPVIVVGNISVGGTGKTPLIIALYHLLTEQGYRVGIVTRGYGRTTVSPMWVSKFSRVNEVGDEALEIFAATSGLIYVDSERSRAVQVMRASKRCDLILSDDGLQHYKMDRQLEIAVVSKSRGFGNGHCLPVGPLRESPERLNSVAHVLLYESGALHSSLEDIDIAYQKFKVKPKQWVNVKTGETRALGFVPGGRLCAYAGLGQPDKFFTTLRALGLLFTEYAKPDHAMYKASDFSSSDFDAYVMTRKDAVKCRDLATVYTWYLEVEAELPETFKATFLEQVSNLVQS